jgi:hypothetical protein
VDRGGFSPSRTSDGVEALAHRSQVSRSCLAMGARRGAAVRERMAWAIQFGAHRVVVGGRTDWRRC